MKDFTLGIQGCAKLKYNFILDLIAKKRRLSSGVVVPGASKYELLCVIYLSQIADSAGYVEQFAIHDLSQILHCSEREVYYLINGLIKKEYITADYYQSANWSGVKNIRLIGNDFSNIQKYTGKDRYISAFYPVFNFNDGSMIEALTDLSLFSLRLLLLLLSMYDRKYGVRVSFQTLMKLLDVHNNKLIFLYLKELERVCGERFFIVVSHGKHLYHMIHIRPNNMYMTPELTERQLTYYKRKWLLKIQNESVPIDPIKTISEYLSMIFQKVYAALSTGLSLENVENIIFNQIKLNGYLDLITLARADNDLDTLVAKT